MDANTIIRWFMAVSIEEIPEGKARFWYGYLYNLLKVLKEIL
jgi:hypothetical protein